MVLPEHAVLKLLLDKSLYLEYNKYIYNIFNKDNNIYLYNIYKSLEALHSKAKESVALEDLHIEFVSSNPNLSEKDRVLYDEVFNLIASASSDPEAVKGLVSRLAHKARLQELALKSYEAASSGKGYEEVAALAEKLVKLEPEKLESFEVVFVPDSITALAEENDKEPGLSWRLDSLNREIGPIRRGDFGFVFARPETGKTTFLASEETHMASQTDRPIFHFNNEERGRKVKERHFQAALGLGLDVIYSNQKKFEKEYQRLTKGNLHLIDSADNPLNRRWIERACEKYKPSLIIFDQLDKIEGFAADREDLVLGAKYIWARELAKEYCPVIAVCQADGTAEGVKWLNMGHVANAKTAKQAEADWILGIGKVYDAGYEFIRHFNVSKNKLTGKHSQWDVIIKPDIARYMDILRNG